MSRSLFPEGVDTFVELFDLPFDQVEAANRLTALKMKDKLTNEDQNELTMLSAQLQDYMITPETWNKFSDALTAVETFFFENVQGWLENKQKIWDSYIRNFKTVGTWEPGKTYKFQNVVSSRDGNAYLCKVDHVSSTANEPKGDGQGNAQWQKIAYKGDKGDVGLSAILKGEWSSTFAYKRGDAVQFGRMLHYTPVVYVALRDNTDKSPDSSPEDWMLYDKVYIGPQLPSGYGIGMHFLEVVN